DADLLADLAALWRNVAVPVVGDLGEAVVEALVDHAGRHPTVVAVDDAHHLTPTTLELLRRLSSTAAPLVVVLAQVASTGGSGRGGGVGLALRGLAPGECRRLAGLAGGEEISDLVATALHAATGGSPAGVRAAVRDTTDHPDDALGVLLL